MRIAHIYTTGYLGKYIMRASVAREKWAVRRVSKKKAEKNPPGDCRGGP